MRVTKHSMSAFASLLVAIFMANWLLTPFLFSRHDHVWCEEHQQFEHVHHHDSDHASVRHSEHHTDHHHAADHTDSNQVSELAEPLEVAASLKSLAERLSLPHEGCHVLAQLNQTASTSVNPDGFGRGQVPDKLPALSEWVAFLPIPKLSLAPKNSPPIV